MTYFKSVAVWQQTSPPAKAALLCGVSLIAWGIVTGLPRAANAQTISGPQSSTVDNTTNTDLTIAPGAVLTGQPGVLIYQPGSATISNAGAIAPAGFSDAIQLNNGISVDLLINTSTGTIAGKTGIYSLSPITTLTNIGTVSAITDGVNSNDGGAITQLINTGTISGGANGLYVYDQITTITNGGLLQGTNVAGIQVNGTSSSNPGFVGVLRIPA